jgi:hypothetical protein
MVHRALGIRATEQAFDAQHVRTWCLERKPFAQQFRDRVDTLRIRYVFLDIGPRALTVEHEVAAVVHERHARRLRRTREISNAKRVHVQRTLGFVFGPIDMVERRAVEDDVGPLARDQRHDCVMVGDVQVIV